MPRKRNLSEGLPLFLSKAHTAKILGISKSNIEDLIKGKILVTYQFKKQVKISLYSVQEFAMNPDKFKAKDELELVNPETIMFENNRNLLKKVF